MLIQENDGTYTGGPLDVLMLLHNVEAGTFHPAFFEEAPMPGAIPPAEEVPVVRLKSKFHHTQGAPTLEAALVLFEELATKIVVRPENHIREPYPWNGEIGIVLLVPNWLRKEG